MPTWIGLDVHKRVCHATVLEDDTLEQMKLRNDPNVLREFFSRFSSAKIAIEATYCWQPVYELAERAGHEVKLAHPKETRIIAKRKIKTDAKDSEALARLLQLGWLPEAYVPPKPIRELRELVYLHSTLVCEQTRMRNKIHAELAKLGIEEPKGLFTRHGKRWLRGLNSRTINACLPVLETAEQQRKELDSELRRRAESNEQARILMTVDGIGYYSALVILAVIGDVKRFPDDERLCSYAGLVPSLDQSGAHRRYGGITKEGNPLLRWIMIQCAWMHLIHAKDSGIKRFYYRLARRKGKQVAIVATARKLLTAVYWMLVRNEPFRG